MKKYEKRPRPEAPASSRTGPRARAAHERQFSDPYARAERPARPPRGDLARGAGSGGPGERPGERAGGRPAVITLDPDVARVFRDSETVNEALRMVVRLARFAGGRPSFSRERPGPARPAPRPSERRERPQERRGPARPRSPRFGQDK